MRDIKPPPCRKNRKDMTKKEAYCSAERLLLRLFNDSTQHVAAIVNATAEQNPEPVVKLLTEVKEFCDTLIAGIREGE